MNLVSRGGYSEVYYDSEKKEIYRRSARYKDEGLDETSMCDIVFTKSFEYSGYTPIVHSETICDKYVSFRMPYYGISLHEWIYKYPYLIRKQYAPQIVMDIIIACMNFQKNAFLHSDLKPSNIMIETILKNIKNRKSIDGIIDRVIVRVIDFNISGVKIVRKRTEWTKTIGTWNFCAPEIIFGEVPNDNTTSWTIGIIASMIIDGYPFTDFIESDMLHNLVPQKEWQDLFLNIYNKYPQHPPLSREEWYDNSWYELIHECTHWTPKDRWGLQKIYNHIYNSMLDSNTKKRYKHPNEILESIPVIEHIIPPRKRDPDKRKDIIHMIYDFCIRTRTINIFPTAISLFDRSDTFSIGEDFMIDAASCLLASSFMFDRNILSSKKITEILMSTFGISDENYLVDHMLFICKTMCYKIWEKPAHVIVAEHTPYNKNMWEFTRDAFLCLEHHEPYTQGMIARRVLDMLKIDTSHPHG